MTFGYKIYAGAVAAFAAWAIWTGWWLTPVEKFSGVPRSVRDNPGSYRSHYANYRRHYGGK
jgi:hypothetical protein